MPNRFHLDRVMPSFNILLHTAIVSSCIGIFLSSIIWLIYFLAFKFKPTDKKIAIVYNSLFHRKEMICTRCDKIYKSDKIRCEQCGDKLETINNYIWSDQQYTK